MKVLAIHPIINPMRVYWFNEINKYCHENKFDFETLFLSQSDKNRNWKNNGKINFKYTILNNFAIRVGKKDLFTFFINPGTLNFLNKTNPDVVLCCQWDHFSAYVSCLWAYSNKKKFILFAESTTFEKSWRRTLFYPLVKLLLHFTNHFWTCGIRASEYLQQLGVKKNKINIFYNSVNLNYFSKHSDQFKINKQNFKKKLNIKTKNVVLFVGQLIERKGIFDLVKGFKLYQKRKSDTTLLIVGTGKEEIHLKRYIKYNHINDVIFTGFVNYFELYKYYSISNIFILPSKEEVWGLVINEAEACGLPIITTTNVGCSPDLVKNYKNGFVIKPNCPKCIADAIYKIFDLKLDTNNTSKKIVSKTSIPSMLEKSNLLN